MIKVKNMNIKKININITESDMSKMIETICTEKQNVKKTNDLANLFTELLLKSTEASSKFIQIMLGNGLPNAFQKNDVVRCSWEKLNSGLPNREEIYEKLKENNLLNVDEEVICKIDCFRGYTEYFPYTVKFKYGEDLYETTSMSFEDILS